MANIKIPNPKSQIPNKFQLPKSQNKSNYLYFFCFGHWYFGACLVFGNCNLEFEPKIIIGF